MANHVEELGSGGEVMHVPPGEDISERLPLVTAISATCNDDVTANDNTEG